MFSRVNNRHTAAVLVSVGLATLSLESQAAVYGFDCISTSPVNCAIGESTLNVEVTAGPALDEVTFTFTNTDTSGSSITDVYFDDGSLLAIANITESSGVSFTQGAAPKSLPGGSPYNWNSSKDFSADSDAPTYNNGVNDPSEWLAVTFTLQGGQGLQDVIDAINLGLANPGVDVTGGLRIGMHVQGYANGGSISLINGTEVPVPAAAWLFGSALLSIAGIKHRK
jgi:hypothetical protein